MLTSTYFEILDVIKKQRKRDILTVERNILLITLILSALPLIIGTILTSPLSGGATAPLGIVLSVVGAAMYAVCFFLAYRIGKNSPIHSKAHISSIKEELSRIGLSKRTLLESVLHEVEIALEKTYATANAEAKSLSSVFSSVFWIPLGVLLFACLQNNPEDISNLDQVLGMYIPFLLCMTFAAMALVSAFRTPVIIVLAPGTTNLERVRCYLLDVMYSFERIEDHESFELQQNSPNSAA